MGGVSIPHDSHLHCVHLHMYCMAELKQREAEEATISSASEVVITPLHVPTTGTGLSK